MNRLTGSKLQLAEKCTHWLLLDADDSVGAAAARGTEFHAHAEERLDGRYTKDVHSDPHPWWSDTWRHGYPDWLWTAERAFWYAEDGSCGALPKAGPRDYSAAPLGSVPFTVDAFAHNGFEGVVVDHKTGRRLPYSPKDSLQLGIAGVVLARMFNLRRVELVYEYVDLDSKTVTRERDTLDELDLAAVEHRIRAILRRGADQSPRPGAHCQDYCPGHRHCATTREIVEDIGVAHKGLISVQQILRGIDSPDRLRDWLDLKPRVTRLIDTLDAEARRYVDASGGAVPLGDGREYSAQTRRRTSIDTKALESELPDVAERFKRTTEYQQFVTRKVG